MIHQYYGVLVSVSSTTGHMAFRRIQLTTCHIAVSSWLWQELLNVCRATAHFALESLTRHGQVDCDRTHSEKQYSLNW
jgi:hypothetical protein